MDNKTIFLYILLIRTYHNHIRKTNPLGQRWRSIVLLFLFWICTYNFIFYTCISHYCFVKTAHIIIYVNIWKHIICIIILYHPLSTSQSEWIAVIPSSLISGNLSKHSCWLWTHDVSYLYPSAARIPPTHFIVMYLYRPHHLGAAIYQS